MVRYYNQHQTPAPKFAVGEKVFLDAADISTTQPTKSSHIATLDHSLSFAQLVCMHIA
jgi:hypothetical protein